MKKLSLGRLKRFCLVPLRGDGPHALAVGRSIRAVQLERHGNRLGTKTGDELAEKLRAARYTDWKHAPRSR